MQKNNSTNGRSWEARAPGCSLLVWASSSLVLYISRDWGLLRVGEDDMVYVNPTPPVFVQAETGLGGKRWVEVGD